MSHHDPFASNCSGNHYHSLKVKVDKARLLEAVAHRLITHLTQHHTRTTSGATPSYIPHPFDRHLVEIGLEAFSSTSGASRLSEKFRTRPQPTPEDVAAEAFSKVTEILGRQAGSLNETNQSLARAIEQTDRILNANHEKQAETLARLRVFQRNSTRVRFWEKVWPWSRKPAKPSQQERLSTQDYECLTREEHALTTFRTLLRQRLDENEALTPALLDGGVQAERSVAELEATLTQGLVATGLYPLNGEALTGATLAEYGGLEKMAGEVERLFLKRTGAPTLDEALGGQFIAEDADLLLESAREVAAVHLREFTVADALVALAAHHPNWVRAFTKLVQVSVETNRFSDPEWKNVMSFNRKMMIATPAAGSPDRKQRLETLFQEFERVGQFSAERIIVAESPESLSIFCATFAVPLECTRFYQRAKTVYASVSDNLQYHPYPEVMNSNRLNQSTGSATPSDTAVA